MTQKERASAPEGGGAPDPPRERADAGAPPPEAGGPPSVADAREAGLGAHAKRWLPSRIWSGTGLMVLGRLYGSACTLASLYLLAGHLGGEAFGRYTFYLALFLVLDNLADLGTGQAAVQMTSREPERLAGVLRTGRRVRLVSAIVGVVLMGGGAFLAGEPGAPWLALASLYPVTHVFELSTVVFKNEIAWAKPVLVRIGAATASLAFVLLLWSLDVHEPALFVLAVASGSTLGNLTLWRVSRPHLPPDVGPAAPLRPFLALALPMGVAGLCQQVYFYVDNLFVRPIAGETALGHYNLAVRVMSYSIMVAVYAPMAALPWLSRENARGRLGPAVGRLALPLFAFAAVAAGLVWPWADALLGLFGEDFVAATDSLHWLLFATVAVYLGSPLLTAVVAAGRSRAVLASALIALTVNLIGNAWLVPSLGIEGAAIATLCTEGAVVGCAFAVLVRAGCSPLRAGSAWAWAAAPTLFFLCRAVSGALRAELWPQ